MGGGKCFGFLEKTLAFKYEDTDVLREPWQTLPGGNMSARDVSSHGREETGPPLSPMKIYIRAGEWSCRITIQFITSGFKVSIRIFPDETAVFSEMRSRPLQVNAHRTMIGGGKRSLTMARTQ